MHADWTTWLIAYVAGVGGLYLCGSLPTGYLLGRMRGVDIRQHGSGNIGATNVLRVLGKGLGALAFLLDVAKGLVPLLVLQAMTADWEPESTRRLLWALAGLAAILGHNYTPWLGFQGGKGIATSAGVLAGLMPWALGVAVAAFLVVVVVTRIVSAGSLAASVALPLAALLFYPGDISVFIFALAIGVLSIWRHRGNMARLAAGTEPRLGRKRPPADSGESSREDKPL